MSVLQLMCVVVLLADATVAGVVHYTACEEYPQHVCAINQVRIDHCTEPNPCKLKKGYPANLSFDFTPYFYASKLKAGLYWTTELNDLPFTNIYGPDGCQFTSCPLESGKTQEVSYALYLNKKLPARAYDMKWRMWNEDNENQGCCFQIRIKLTK